MHRVLLPALALGIAGPAFAQAPVTDAACHQGGPTDKAESFACVAQ